MLATVISFLIYVCVLVLAIYLVIWVLRDVLSLSIPEKAIQIVWAIVVLVVLLWLVQMLLPGGGGSFRLPRPF